MLTAETSIEADPATTMLLVSRMETASSDPQLFDTIQGEGRHTGEPATFLRLSGCNLTCRWCDVPETWRFAESAAAEAPHDDDKTFERELEELLMGNDALADMAVAKAPRRFIVTGGEPLIQQPKIIDLFTRILQRDHTFKFEIETNGTIRPRDELAVMVDQFNVSPKLANSGNRPTKRRRSRALSRFTQLPQADFKFVIASDADFEEVLGLVDEYGIAPDRVWLMPEGRTQAEIIAGQQALVDFCIGHGFHLGNRLHIFLFGDKRGT